MLPVSCYYAASLGQEVSTGAVVALAFDLRDGVRGESAVKECR